MSEFKAEVNKALKGHTSMETAYLVKDYPYGFRLRCQIKYWLEFKKGKGFRFVSQTSNPKAEAGNGSPAGTVWNKPKASTYIENAAFMYLDLVGHVQWHGLGIYNDAAESKAFREEFGANINDEWLPALDHWVALKESYEARKAALVAAQGVDNFSQNNLAAIQAVAEVNSK
jgi:hypothetical protein